MALPMKDERSSFESDPYAANHIYYGKENSLKSRVKTRTYSTTHTPSPSLHEIRKLTRRGSHDEIRSVRRFLLRVDETLKSLESEDTDQNGQITIEDTGPKVLYLGTLASNGFKKVECRGNYMVSNLLQELTLAKEHGLDTIVLDEDRLNENPVNRMKRLIKHSYWQALTRVQDGTVIEKAGKDPKDWTDDPRPRIYIPVGAPEQYEYYKQVAIDRPEIRLDVCMLPANITPEAVLEMNAKPGLLALAMEPTLDPHTGKTTLKGLPFVVPGGRFNELYGWDSYMESLGLIIDGRVDLAKSMALNFCFSIEHYGKILNANRSYYLSRSQPPFLTDMALRIFDQIKSEPGAKDFLRTAILAAIKEYTSVWIAEPRLDPVTGLSRYRPEGLGVPPETEATHFTHILEPYAKKNGMAFDEFVAAYNKREVLEPELDEYFLHDRAVRESGHDTTYRLEGVCANLATVDLNCLLYKYEKDISWAIKTFFDERLSIPAEYATGDIKPDSVQTSALWDRRARKRKSLIDKYLWNPDKHMYFDYDTVKQEQCTYESVTCFWALWAGVASTEQSLQLVRCALPKLEAAGGLLAGTEESRGEIGLDRPNRQWDFPYGWAPHQILAWTGMQRYGFHEEAERLAYKWLFMMTTAFVDYNGVIVEKYDVTRTKDPHVVDAEYGNQGLDFKGVAKEGFGWVNSSFVVGLAIVNEHMRRALGTLTTWESYKKATDLYE